MSQSIGKHSTTDYSPDQSYMPDFHSEIIHFGEGRSNAYQKWL
jgi:hypothetical protein